LRGEEGWERKRKVRNRRRGREEAGRKNVGRSKGGEWEVEHK